MIWEPGLDSSGSLYGSVADSCEHGHKRPADYSTITAGLWSMKWVYQWECIILSFDIDGCTEKNNEDMRIAFVRAEVGTRGFLITKG